MGRAVARGLGAAAAALALLGCAATPVPCRSPSTCPTGTECLAQRCAPLGAEPVPPATRRLVLEPADVALVSERTQRGGGLPPTVAFGGAPGATEELLVRFGGGWRTRDVVAAFLLLEPAAQAEPSVEDVELEVALASSAWSSSGARPRAGRRGPVGAALGRTRPPQPLRVDVTALLRELGDGAGDGHGFVLRAGAASARAAVYSTGSGGPPPRLDLYLRPDATP